MTPLKKLTERAPVFSDSSTVWHKWRADSISAGLVCLALFLTGCDREEKLPGVRIDPRVPLERTEHLVSPVTATEVTYFDHGSIVNQAEPFTLTAPVINADWTHINGNARHTGFHPQLGRAPRQIWAVRVGEGNSRRARINASPIVAGNHVYVMDSNAQLSAYTLAGSRQWSLDLARTGDAGGRVGPGGIAYDEGMLFVTTEAGRLYFIEAETGQIIRTQDFDAAAKYPPSAADGRVFLTTADGKGWGVNAT
ncbi:MAG: PQQ-binding-like beta-propeller repeat protein, partial [Rhodobacteraceae bacterium]|nr:PQQ-binding-like beta-propeller repeat protein [Paracoccaceae bacterium]